MPYERCEMSKDEFEIDKMLDFERAVLSFQIAKPRVRFSISWKRVSISTICFWQNESGTIGEHFHISLM